MTLRAFVLSLFAAGTLASPAVAGPCDDLAKLAEKTGGAWPRLKELPPRSAARDGPWYSPGAREEHAWMSGFVPQALADRTRLQAEAKGDALAAAYLAPTAKAFDAAMTSVESEVESGAVAVRVHRFAGTRVFSVSAHDEQWYDCQRDIALFYSDAAGKLHYASAGNIGDCVSRGDLEQGAIPVTIDGRFAFVDETPDLSAVTGAVGLRQIVYPWQGDRLGAGCPLAYRYQVGYVFSDETEYSDDKGKRRPANSWDGYLRRSFQPWMADYAKAMLSPAPRSDKAAYEEEMARLRGFSGLNPVRFLQLKAAYDALLADHRVHGFMVVLPVEHDGQAYLVTLNQRYDGREGDQPWFDVVLYSADGKPPHRMGNILIERQVERLLSVKVEAKKAG